ncbi:MULTISPECIES: hypothetical protein [unclassified Methanoculleus]|uniref:hypothetical protein n=2 Tax=Methanoculleus TaxID=45989 RepID=UPI0025D9871F|nr:MULTISPECIES: hypothetical protein [unclassified Methanoculleus]MDD2253160.1 hypothetical protein [Methanoculleus sp.]MDD2787657.1 hypothetical protein [Methanoculleus sp.]MDD3215819.1 hypothetical protein [Methanoculleus sp.]MDD4313745.1 hypothetical protein [Methanoculleus sp.]MDD4471190.1 hypothetical protein [Methanoculleus sp.]
MMQAQNAMLDRYLGMNDMLLKRYRTPGYKYAGVWRKNIQKGDSPGVDGPFQIRGQPPEEEIEGAG